MPAKICEHNRSQGVSSVLLSALPRSCTHSSRKTIGDHSRPCTNIAFGDSHTGGIVERFSNLLLSHMTATDIVEVTVIAFTDDRVDSTCCYADSRMLLDHVCHERISDTPYVERICKENGSFQLPQFSDLHQTNGFPKPIKYFSSSGHLGSKEVPTMGYNSGHSRSHRPHSSYQWAVSTDKRGMTNTNTGHIRNGIHWPWNQRSHNNTSFTRPQTLHCIVRIHVFSAHSLLKCNTICPGTCT